MSLQSVGPEEGFAAQMARLSVLVRSQAVGRLLVPNTSSLLCERGATTLRTFEGLSVFENVPIQIATPMEGLGTVLAAVLVRWRARCWLVLRLRVEVVFREEVEVG